MADLTWTATTPLQHAVTPGRHGAVVNPAGIHLSEVGGFGLVLILARRGRWSATVRAARTHFGVEPPARPQAVPCGQGLLIWSGPEQMIALFPRRGTLRPLDALRDAFAGVASLSDQSDGRCMIRISGARARAMLAKLSSLDLHDAAFPAGAAAATAMDHAGVNLWRESDDAEGHPVFSVLVPSTFAESFWHALVDSSAEYGVDMNSARAAPTGTIGVDFDPIPA